MSEIERRKFLAAVAGTAACVGSTLSGSPRLAAAQAATDAIALPPQMKLGKTGITMSRVGQGTGMRGGNRQSNQTRLGFEKLVGMFRNAYDRGVTFFDLADLYGSHLYFREALRHIPREKVTILTKLWWRYDGGKSGAPADYQGRAARTALERFRHELATDYVDIVLLHCVTTPGWEKELAGYMDALAEAKEKKQVRAVGVSCHGFEALKAAAASPWVDVLLARMNPKGVKMDASPEQVIPVLRQAKESGKGLIGMKIYGEGKLADQKDECIRFAQGLGLLDSMTVGAESREQMDETLRLIAKYPIVATR